MYTPFTDLSGEKYGKLRVIRLAYMREKKNGRRESFWLCECECGNTTTIRRANLVSGNTISCGCYRRKIMKDGLHKGFGKYRGLTTKEHHLYNRWLSWHRRGKLCEEWLDFDKFYAFMVGHGFNESCKIQRNNMAGPLSPDNFLIVNVAK